MTRTRRLSKREKALLAVLGAVVVTVAYYACAVRPLSSRLRSLDATVAALERESARLSAWKGREEELSSGNQELRAAVEALARDASGMPPPEILVSVERAARSANVTLGDMRLQLAGQDGAFTLTASGGYREVREFVKALEEMRLALSLEKIRVAASPTANGVVEAMVSGRVYNASVVGEPAAGSGRRSSPFDAR